MEHFTLANILCSIVLAFFTPLLVSAIVSDRDKKKFKEWLHQDDQHTIELFEDLPGMKKGMHVVDHLKQDYNEIYFQYMGAQRSAVNWNNQPQFRYLGKIEPEKKVRKRKSMPRIVKYIFWIMMLMLMWKFVTNVDGIVLFLTKRFIGGI